MSHTFSWACLAWARFDSNQVKVRAGGCGVNLRACVGEVCGMIFVGEKDGVHGEDANPANCPGLDGVAAESFPVGGKRAAGSGQFSRQLCCIAQKWPIGLDVVVTTLIVIVAGGYQDLRLVESLAQLPGKKFDRLEHKSAVVLSIAVVRGLCICLGKSVG